VAACLTWNAVFLCTAPRALSCARLQGDPCNSAGEVLGCTAPVVAEGADAIVFVADGRFHLEAIMIANPTIPAYRQAAALLHPHPHSLSAA
jgi:diphthamide biosynthesis enzyme Dph1/Dph2-like protein